MHYRIKGKIYEHVDSERMSDLRLIERVTGLTHREWRARLLDQRARLSDAKTDELDNEGILRLLDDMVTLGDIAVAVAHGNPGWSTSETAQFVDALELGDVEIKGGGDADPPAEAAATHSKSGTESAPPSKPLSSVA